MRALKVMLCLLVFLVIPAGIGARKHPVETPEDAERAEIHDYRLSLDKLERAAEAGDEILKLCTADPNLAGKVDEVFAKEPPLDEQARNIESELPQIAAILHAHRLTTREFLLIRFALVLDLFYVESKMEDGKPVDPEDCLPANVALIEKNLEHIRALGIRIFADKAE